MDFVNVDILYEGARTTISCNINDKMKDIFNKFTTKMNLKRESVFFIYKGNIIMEDKKLNEIMNKKEDKDGISIIAFIKEDEDNKLDIIVNSNKYKNNEDKYDKLNNQKNNYFNNLNQFQIIAEFSFDGDKIIIPCNIDDKLEVIINRFSTKVRKDPNNLCFICNGQIIDINLKAKELINKGDNIIKFLVYLKSNINNINNQLMVFNSFKKELHIKEFYNLNVSYFVEDKIEKYNETHQKKNFEQLPTYIFKQEPNLDYISNCSKINEKRIPIININEKEYDYFMKLLPHFKVYSKYNNIKILNTKFICPNKKIEHINKKENIFFAECSYNLIPYSKEEYLEYENQIKTELKGENILDVFNYIEEWVRCLFNIMADYIIFILYKKPIYYLCKKCFLPNLYIQKNEKNNNPMISKKHFSDNKNLNLINNMNNSNDNENSFQNINLTHNQIKNIDSMINMNDFSNNNNFNQINNMNNFNDNKNCNQIINLNHNDIKNLNPLINMDEFSDNKTFNQINNMKNCKSVHYFVNEVIKGVILQFISIKFANSIIELMDFDSKICQNYIKIINGISNNKNNNYSIGNPPKKKGNKNLEKYNGAIEDPPKEEEGENINIIYYDENIKGNNSDVFRDSKLFERVISKGIFILATEEKKLKLILEEIKEKIMEIIISI